MGNSELLTETERLKQLFAGADPQKLLVLDALIQQAAVETILLKRLNGEALETGLVKYHPENASLQRALPVSAQIAKHSAALTNIMDKLMKHLEVVVEEDDGLGEFE